jgi:hypothetical protein
MAKTTGKAVAAGALLVSALVVFGPTTLRAQGKSNQPHGHPAPPSSNPLPIASVAAPGFGAMPLAWVDDANLMEPGAMAIDLSISRWQGNGIGETDVPVVNVAVGVTDRFQFAASVPRVVGNDASGVVGGLGTTYFSGKYAAYAHDRLGLKVAVAPTLELLGTGVLQALAPGETRAQFGVPVSLEIDRNGRRFYASGGWFSRGVWFAGAGAGMQVAPRVGVSASFSHSWTGPIDLTGGVPRDRTELSGGVAYALVPHVSVFGSLGHTIATLDENGAGTTVSGGVSIYISPPASPHPRPRP